MYWITKILKVDKTRFNLSPLIEQGRIHCMMMISSSIISASGILLNSEPWTKFVPLV